MDSQVIVASGRRCQRPFTRRLLDLPWEDVLLPHVLNRVPLCQLLRLQRVSRAFRALVQLHLAGLRRFDAAQVSRGLKPRPCLGTAPPLAQPPVPQYTLLDPLGPSGLPGEGCTQQGVLPKGKYWVATQRESEVSPGRAGGCQKRTQGRIGG